MVDTIKVLVHFYFCICVREQNMVKKMNFENLFFFKSRNKLYLSNQRPIRITIIGCSVNSLRMKISDIIHSLTLVLKFLEVKSIDCKNMTEENIKRIRDISLHENTINCCAFYSHLLFKVLKIFAIILR